MDELAAIEYKALRATIRESGTVRAITFLVTLCIWALLELALTAYPQHAMAPLIPLLVLVAGFETFFHLHLGVERVGRIRGLPLGPGIDVFNFQRTDRPAPRPGQVPVALYRTIDPDYFPVMGIPIVAGRNFQPGDRAGSAPVVTT
jgi:hypothetical protein